MNLNSEFTKIEHDNEKILSITVKDENSNLRKIDYDHYFISSPFTKIVENLSPKPPENILTSCKNLKYRHHIGVKLLVSGKSFPDNWIYIHDPKVKMARVSNYLNFSKEMSKDPNINPLTVEYFCFEEDQVWKMNKDELISLAEQELRFTKLINESNKIINGFIVRSLDAYPVIKKGYQEEVEKIKSYISRFKNLHPIGRSGMFKYNNQDHAIATGIYATKEI